MMIGTPVERDAVIHRKVIEELRWDTRVDETDVGVEVDGGIVTLTGHVSSYAKRVAAEEAARRVAGVLDIANDVQVHVTGETERTDTEVARAVRNALENDDFITADEIECTVTNGWVILKGTVRYWREREDAQRAILRVKGVRGLTNMLTVRPQDVQPRVIRQTIADALERRAEREAKHISIDVDGDVVTLSGPVRTWRDRQAVLGAASHAPGVGTVVDHMMIVPNS